jgi:hypothetical protein
MIKRLMPFVISLFLAACSYNAKILLPPDDSGASVKGKYPLTAAIIVTPQQKNETLSLRIDITTQTLKPFPDMYQLMQMKMRPLFASVDIVEEEKLDDKKYDVLINTNTRIAFSQAFEVNYQAKAVEPKSGFEFFNASTDKREAYRLPGAAGVAAFLTGFTLGLASPITLPIATDSIGSYSEKTITNMLSQSLDETVSLMSGNQQLKRFAATGAVQLPAGNVRPDTPGPGHGASPQIDDVRVVQSDIDILPAVKRKSGKAYAIVVGIENYRQKLPKADFATQDAKLVTAYLVGALGYPEENVVTLTNEHAGLGDFIKYFEKWLPNNVEPNSLVFVYYSGHGAPNPKTGDAYLVPYDGDPTFIDETGYSLKRMYGALGKLPAKEVVVALDSCFSGAGGRSVLAKGARPIVLSIENSVLLNKNITVLSASAGDQVSSTYDEKGHGLFTYYLLKGIKNEDVVRQDGSLDIVSLYDYVKPQVSSIARKKYNNEQTPQLIGAKNK